MTLFKPRYRSETRPEDAQEPDFYGHYVSQQPSTLHNRQQQNMRYPRQGYVGGVEVPQRPEPPRDMREEQNASGFAYPSFDQGRGYHGPTLQQPSYPQTAFASPFQNAPRMEQDISHGTDPQRSYRERLPEKKSSPTRFVLIIAAIIILCAASWFCYRWLSSPRNQPIPLYTAEEGAFKVRPDDPGGVRIPHQEKLVYDRFETSRTQPRQEQLLPEPEKPISPPDLYYPPAGPQQLPAAQQPTQPPAPDYHPGVPYNPDGTPQRPVYQAPPVAVPPAPQPVSEEEPTENEEDASIPPVAPDSVEIPKLTTRKHRLQLASLESKTEAISEMLRYRQEFSGVFTGKTVTVQKSGKFWRVLVGPYKDYAAAKSDQAKLRKKGQDSNLVAPA